MSLHVPVVGFVGSVACALLPSLAARSQCTTQWEVAQFGSGLNGGVRAVATGVGGTLYVGGQFTVAGGVPAAGVASWQGGQWTGLTTSLGGTPPTLARALLPGGDGTLLVGGSFTAIGGMAAANIARWDGMAWSAIGAGLATPLPSDGVEVIVRLPNGHPVAGGSFSIPGAVPVNNVAAWDDTTWYPLGLGFNARVHALVVQNDGSLVAGGEFTKSGSTVVNHVARWDGTGWHPLGLGMNDSVQTLLVVPGGDLIAGGDFTTAGGAPAGCVARWNGTAWTPFGAGVGGPNRAVYSLARLANGDVVAAGRFTSAGGGAATHIARWDGSSWHAMGGPTEGLGGAGWATAVGPDGTLVVGGLFASAGGSACANLASWASSCASAVESLGYPCPSSGGANQLIALSPPWIGQAFGARGSGMPTSAAVLSILGLAEVAPAVSLHAFFSEAPIGCDVFVSPDAIELLAAAAGVAESLLLVPNATGLIGAQFLHQMVPVELSQSSAVLQITSTNALRMTLGAY